MLAWSERDEIGSSERAVRVFEADDDAMQCCAVTKPGCDLSIFATDLTVTGQK